MGHESSNQELVFIAELTLVGIFETTDGYFHQNNNVMIVKNSLICLYVIFCTLTNKQPDTGYKFGWS